MALKVFKEKRQFQNWKFNSTSLITIYKLTEKLHKMISTKFTNLPDIRFPEKVHIASKNYGTRSNTAALERRRELHHKILQPVA